MLRELIVNAIAHNQTLEKMLAGVQYSRNQILVRILREVGEMDERGMGLRRKVLPVLKEQGFPEPELEPGEDFFKVTIWQSGAK